ncbi:vacuolar protein sorting 13D isoform X4 [Oratosquilla oratoria]|uniref:vacuolar protein sorting 13D isoform X4 n=1 Tax=Oratosquilla oratoria TaxID=337810 RepID=UPI003F759CE2
MSKCSIYYTGETSRLERISWHTSLIVRSTLTMLEGLATWVLNNYLGKYLENLNTDQLSIGLLKGEVELENVPLRKDALRYLEMPVEVKAGFVGKVRLQIPVSRLRSEPWLITFEQLYMVAGPVDLEEHDEEAEEKANHNRKIAKLDSLEAAWRAEQEANGDNLPYAQSYSTWLSYGTSFITNIIENIQLKIKDVHIRYEDSQSIPGHMFAFGMTVDSLSVQSSDDHWIPRFVYGGASKMAYKLLELQNLAIYWDTSSEVYSNKTLSEIASLMLCSIEKKNHEYILLPVSATACVKRNLSEAPLRSRHSPRITCDLKLEKFPLSLSDSQYKQLVKWNKAYDLLDRARHFRKWRPRTRVKENPYDWWQYAIQCHLDRIHRKYSGRSWAFAHQRAKDIIEYVNIYCEHLQNPAVVTTERKAHKMGVEQDLGYEELRVLREIAMERVSKEEHNRRDSTRRVVTTDIASSELSTSPKQCGEGMLQRWFPSWGGWYSSEQPQTNIEEAATQESPMLSLPPPESPSPKEETPPKGSLEEELLYVLTDSIENNTFMKRDAVFCQLSFTLKQGTVSLFSSSPSSPSSDKEPKQELQFELELERVNMALESRPRSKSYRFDIELGSMNLKDKVTVDTAFPLLVSPQKQDPGRGINSAMSRTSAMYSKLTSILASPQGKLPNVGPLFSLTYENRPLNSKADHRLVVKSSALDIVYNASAFQAIKEFFTTPYSKKEVDHNTQMTALTSAARKRYEELKEQTKLELKKNWDQILEGSLVMRKRWDIQLDVSAPQIIVPEHFHDRSATLVVLDFGKLLFCSARDGLEKATLQDEIETNSDDEDEFATPCSTPEEMDTLAADQEKGVERRTSASEFPLQTEAELHEKIYDRYELKLCDLQVLVGKVRDNWRFAYLKGTGPMHVVDRFSINLQLERRVVVMPDAQWPSATLAGTLPKLVLHINEHKVLALQTMMTQFIWQTRNNYNRHETKDPGGGLVRSDTLATLDGEIIADGFTPGHGSLQNDEAKLVVMQFTVDKMSLELQSRGRSIAELQVTGVRATLNKRPYEMSATLNVHSLLLVDALQTFGPDFELLVASHKHVSMDSVSGSLLDSEPCSPTSPGSPDPTCVKPTSPIALTQAISSLAAAQAQGPPQIQHTATSPPVISSPLHGPGQGPIFGEGQDMEALISLEVTYVSHLCPSQQGSGSLLLASVQFNTLDIIANQETVVELVGFIQQLMPYQPPSYSHVPAGFDLKAPDKLEKTEDSDGSRLLSHSTPESGPSPTHLSRDVSKTLVRAEVSFDFHKLTVLLLRGAYKDKELVGRKVGTAVMSDAKIQATVENDILRVEGSLGGFQIRDVTPEGNKHQCIISVGQDPIVEKSQDLFSRLNHDLYRSASHAESSTRAFIFTVIRPLAFTGKQGSMDDLLMNDTCSKDRPLDSDSFTLKLHMASVCYTHSPNFLTEIRSCASEFKRYMARVANSIKHAATEMAIGLVSKRIESFVGLSSGTWEASPRHRRKLSISKSSDTLNLPAPPPASASGSRFSPAHEESTDLAFDLILDVVLETPIVVLPEAPNSADVLVAHLGRIIIANAPSVEPLVESYLSYPQSKLNVEADFRVARSQKSPRTGAPSLNKLAHLFQVADYQVEVRNMSLYSLNVEERLRCRETTFHQLSVVTPLSTSVMRADELYSCHDHGQPILHSTTIEFHIKHERAAEVLADHESGLFFPNDFFVELHPTVSRDSLQVDGGLVTDLKISVSRHQYRQIINSLSNISMSPYTEPAARQPLSAINEEGSSDANKDQHKRRSTYVPAERESTTLSVKGSFSVPSLIVELRGDVGEEKEKPLVNLLLEELNATYESTEKYTTNTMVTLKSLIMEDLQQDKDSHHRYLMKSDIIKPEIEEMSAFDHVPQFISASCPEAGMPEHNKMVASSLPDKLKMEKPFFKMLKKQKASLGRNLPMTSPRMKDPSTAKFPSTPPPSPTAEEQEQQTSRNKPDEALVVITIFTVDKRSPEFISKYDGTNRLVDVDFNSLNAVINIPSWVMMLDFFSTARDGEGVSEPVPVKDNQISNGRDELDGSTAGTEEINTTLEIQVRSLTLILNQPECELARANISQVMVRSIGSDGNTTLSGRLGSLSLIDMTPQGALYREKFMTAGSEAMTFQIFKYGLPDRNLLRECDIRMKLRMSSVMYTHTQRFAMKLTQFVQEFNQLNDIMSRWRATSAGLKVFDDRRSSRVSLDISAGSPVIFLPMSSRSDVLLVADLGSLTIVNKFLFMGSQGSISKVQRQDLVQRLMHSSDRLGMRSRSHSKKRDGVYTSDSDLESDQRTRVPETSHKCLLDVMHINLVNMDIYTSVRLRKSYSHKRNQSFEHASQAQTKVSQLRRKDSDRILKREGESIEWLFNSYKVIRKGSSLLQDKCALKVQVERNLDTFTSRAVPDISVHGMLSKVHATIDTSSYKLIRGLLAHNLGEPLPNPPMPFYPYQSQTDSQDTYPTSVVWTSLNIHFDLDNVTLELENLNDNNETNSVGKKTSPLACVNFIKSRLIYESFSDGSKDVDLVSQEILISDTRFEGFPVNKKSNVFTNILQPTPSKAFKNKSQLQAEVHYRSTKDVTRFTILLNNMRLMAILDWWAEIQNFIHSNPENPFSKKENGRKSEKGEGSSSPATPYIFSPLQTPTVNSPRTYSPAMQSPRSTSPLPNYILDTSSIPPSSQPPPSVSPRLNPMVESTGLMTKHALIMEQPQIPFELKLNITDSELVVVENTSVWDTSAVILKSTAVISYRPQLQERPLSCNLNQCELYSCILGLEDDTALSIIDPVTVNIEVNDKASQHQVGDISNVSMNVQHTVEIVLHQLNIRLSYHDMKLFQQILESVPKQRASTKKNSPVGEFDNRPANFQVQVGKLSGLGFHKEDCIRALEVCGGRLDDAALWLTHNALPVPAPTIQQQQQTDDMPINFQSLEIKTGSVNICVIDDCGDCDVPLIESSLTHLGLKQDKNGKGSASCTFSIDYYNRALSGWEPFLEPWNCTLEWSKTMSSDLKGARLILSLKAEDTVNVNITTTLIDLYHLVKTNWTHDYYNRDRIETETVSVGGSESSKTVVSPQNYRRRSPFIPFALKNDTGCDLSFATLTTTPDSLANTEVAPHESILDNEWIMVSPGGTMPFSFEGPGKQRHRDTHELKVHQLVVRVDGWQMIGPVTVDKVGVFFRLAAPQTSPSALHSELPSARVVMAVTLDGSARKLVTVRSALLLTNYLHFPVEIKMNNVALRLGAPASLTKHLSTGITYPVPLRFLESQIHVKPVPERTSCVLGFANRPVFCIHTLRQGHAQDGIRQSDILNSNRELPYRFCVHVRRDNYPQDPPPAPTPVVCGSHSVMRTTEWIQPGHTIMLISPLTMVNLLPYDLHYEVHTTGNSGRIRPGEDACLHSIDPSQSITLTLWTDMFRQQGEVTLNPSNTQYTVAVKLCDNQNRPLYVFIKGKPQCGGALKILVFAHYWLINKTGLPLIFKQEGVNNEAAGQDEEHEMARCAAPLLFSFTDRDATPLLLARVGNRLHEDAKPQYCHKLPLTQGTWVRRLRVSLMDTRPDFVYIVGVDVRPGRGRYRDTYMVTFSPRFQIENRSSHELMIAQKCFTSSFITAQSSIWRKFQDKGKIFNIHRKRGYKMTQDQSHAQLFMTDPGAQSTWLRAIPGCWLPFHWPRLDKDQLLCILLKDIPGCHWSGGFPTEIIDSFHLNIRDNNCLCHFIRVEIIMSDATYFIVFTDADTLPPPFRIDNFSEVPIIYYQTGTQEERLRSMVKPRSCVSYAWDEVIAPPHLTCVAPGGTSATYNLNLLGEGAQLTYENFIYIAFTGTFKKVCVEDTEEDVTFDPTAIECQQLVLDVPEGTRVRLARKELGRRSQLWRMTSTGMLQHEGSSPPQDPTKKKQNNANILVLDIAGPAPQPTEYQPLMLRKPDERRKLTQTWRFKEDGRLCCEHPNLYVQAKDGFLGLVPGSCGGSWQLWNDVVLGPQQLIHYSTMDNGMPVEQSISRQRLRPGSGLLAVRVVTDGPTRVLQITDIQNKNQPVVARTENGDLVCVSEGNDSSVKKMSCESKTAKPTPQSTYQEIQVQLLLHGGLGLSVVQRSPPQELIYAKYTDIVFEYQSSPQHRMIDCSVRDIQVDNQVIDAQCPVVLYVTPQSKSDDTRHLPAIHMSAYQQVTNNINAYIFKNLMITLKNLTLTLEEALLFKLLLMAGYDLPDAELEKVEENTYDTRRMLAAATSVNATRYYFTHLKLMLNQVKLSVLTSKKLSPELKNVKRKVGLTLVRFENAQVTLDPFVRFHPFETSTFLLDCIMKHYKEELKSQAMRILGSTDFLGNPFGFLADVSEGVSELVHGGNLGGLVLNVTHGMANSTAKVTGSLSDAVGHVTMDDRHEEYRQKLRNLQVVTSSDHFMAGLKGLGLGLYGGLTSIVYQTYTGAASEGLPGFFSGFAKGMVGTVTKPAIGFLDLATGTASAVRDTSKNPSQKLPPRTRKPRLVIGLNGMMPSYSTGQAAGQELLLTFDPSQTEVFLGHEILREGPEDLKVLISSEQVRVFSQNDPGLTPVLTVYYRDLYQCQPIVLNVLEEQKHYIELTMKADKLDISGVPGPSEIACKRPKVRCDTRAIACKVAQQINYARNLHEELHQTVTEFEDDQPED